MFVTLLIRALLVLIALTLSSAKLSARELSEDEIIEIKMALLGRYARDLNQMLKANKIVNYLELDQLAGGTKSVSEELAELKGQSKGFRESFKDIAKQAKKVESLSEKAKPEAFEATKVLMSKCLACHESGLP